MAAKSWSKLRRFSHHVGIVVFISLPVALAGCVYDPAYYGPPSYVDYYPDYYDYYFYPSVGVYFHFTTGDYYYRDHDRWVRTRVLPPYIRIDPRDRVKLRIDSNKPYVKYPEHSRTYQPKPVDREAVERSTRERDANRRWYQEYEKNKEKFKGRDQNKDRGQDQGKDKDKDKDKDQGRDRDKRDR